MSGAVKPVSQPRPPGAEPYGFPGLERTGALGPREGFSPSPLQGEGHWQVESTPAGSGEGEGRQSTGSTDPEGKSHLGLKLVTLHFDP